MPWRTRNRMSNLCSTTRHHTRNSAKQRAAGGPARTVPCGRGGEWLQRRCECFQSRFDGTTSTGRSRYTMNLYSLHPDITVFLALASRSWKREYYAPFSFEDVRLRQTTSSNRRTIAELNDLRFARPYHNLNFEGQRSIGNLINPKY